MQLRHTEAPEDDEVALIKLANHRDSEPQPPAEGEEEVFDPAKIPAKIPLVKPRQGDLKTAVYHSEASYSLRKVLIEQAKKQFPELEKAEVNQLLAHSNQRTRMVEDRLEEHFIKTLKFGKGCMHEDFHSRIVFKTFLQN